MPSFYEQADMLRRWRALPGLERLAAPRRGAEPADARSVGVEPAVVLTFDDGPDPDATPGVLEALAAAGLRATFFLLGEQVALHRGLGREVAERGHEIALHGFGHAPHDTLDRAAARDDLLRGLDAVESATGRRPARYRPPFGRFSPDSYAACRELSLEPVYWSAWGLDWEAIPGSRIAELAARDLVPGAIVLLHDSARYSYRPTAEPSAQAVGPLAALARERGLRLAALEEVAGGR